jgi:hypothetical protein
MPGGEIHWAFFLYIIMATVAFFSGNTFFSKLIKWFTKSPISHSAIGFTGKDGKQYWLEAVGAGVRIIPREWETDLYAEFQMLPNVDDEVALAEKKVGEPYAKLTIVGFVIMKFAKWFGIGINNPFYEKSAVICSEFVVESDTQHLIKEFDGLDPANISPAALFDICQKGSSFKRIT